MLAHKIRPWLSTAEFLPITRIYAGASAALLVLSVVATAASISGRSGSLTIPAFLFAALGVYLALAAVLFFSRTGGSTRALADATIPPDVTDVSVGLIAPFSQRETAGEDALRVAQATHIVNQLDVMMMINIVNAVLVAIAIQASANPWLLATWLIVVLGMTALGVRARMKSRGSAPPKRVSKRTLRRISLHCGIRGLLWGVGFAMFFPSSSATGQLILLSVAMGMMAGGVPAVAPVPAAALLFGLGIIVPTLTTLVAIGNVDHFMLATFGLMFSASMVMIATQLYRSFASNVVMQRTQGEQSAAISLLLNEYEAAASDWLWETDENGTLVRLPQRMRELFGIVSDPLPSQFKALLRSSDTEGADEILRQMAMSAPFRGLVVKTMSAAGQDHWIALTASPKTDGGYLGFGSDITSEIVAQTNAASALRRAERAEQRLKDGIDALGAGFILTDRADQTLIANQRFHQMLPGAGLLGPNARFADVAATHAELWFANDPAKKQAWLDAALLRRGTSVEPFDIDLPTGKWLRIEARTTTEGGIVTVLTDITDIKQQEATLALQTRRLAQSNNELQQFATVASHDLQEPLRKIEAFGARLQKRAAGTLDADSNMYIDRMINATQRMRSLIQDLLSYSRVARQNAEFKTIDLDRVLAEVVDDLSVAIEEKKAVVQIEPLGAMSADATQIRQLAQNLIANALKFIAPGITPHITISRCVLPAGEVQLRFADNGIGFDMQYHDKIFEIFQRLHGREEYQGTGVGLATCRRIVERHNGGLRAESAVGKGATFIATFPASQMATIGKSTVAANAA